MSQLSGVSPFESRRALGGGPASVVEEEVARTRLEGQVERLDRLVSECVGGGRVAVDGRTVYVRLPGRPNGADFMLRVRCDEWYPIHAPSYDFVDPITLKDGGIEFWPDDGDNAFRTLERHPWVCLPGTVEYRNHHSNYWYNPRRDSICQIVFHILQRIAGREGGRP